MPRCVGLGPEKGRRSPGGEHILYWGFVPGRVECRLIVSSKLPIVQAEPSEVQGGPANRSYPPSFPHRRVYIDTFGCQMNQHDSERMFGLMAQEGYMPTADPEDADLIVLNSCSIRDKAEHKVLSRAGAFRTLKSRRPDLVLAIGGCVAQQEGERLLKKVRHADLVFGPDHIANLPELVDRARRQPNPVLETSFLLAQEHEFPPFLTAGASKPSAFVSVMKGCDKYCSFCVVPFTRGREVSRSASEILEEVRRLADAGTKEVILLGQTVNSYGRKKQDGQMPFHELLAKTAQVRGIERVRFTSPHPSEFKEEQITAFRDIPELCPHMHLPVQSGSSAVLKAMRRGYTREAYIEIVQRLKSVAPDVALTTDIIVGFPGETASDFEETLSLMEEVQFHGSFSFAYSERQGTRAADMGDSVPEGERLERLYALQALQDRITASWLTKSIGKSDRVLIEGPSKLNPSRSTGRNGQNRPVHVEGEYPPGRLLDVEIVEAFKHSLLGRALS